MVYFKHMRGGLSTTGRPVRLWYGVRSRLLASRGDGFTIVEVMVVLVVTAALFVSAAILISGRQNQAAFDQSIRQVQSQIQQVINEVETGYYPNRGSFTCVAGASGQPPTLSAGSAGQGTNSGCIFLGKALQFGIGGTSPDQFAVYTVAGLKDMGACGSESACLGSTKPMVVAPSSPTHNNANYPDNSVNNSLQNGLRISDMWYENSGTNIQIGAVAFANSLYRSSSGSIIAGTGQVNVIAVSGTSLNKTKLETVEVMNSDAGNKIATGILNPVSGVFICFESGSTNQYGVIKIGGDSRELSVTLSIKDKNASSPTCASA